ncbi:MAG: ribonuclease H family protein [Clostridia bacterium]|nr:ribonuclease H family protein [Clostridia bacterium]MBQ7751786.1 ribonuclease H family protein [Clostridia bacterium]
MKYYAVKNGRKIGIFTDWESCRMQVEGFSGAEYKSFLKEADARAYLKGEQPLPTSETVAYVDGSFNAKTGEYSFGAVIFQDGKTAEYSEKFGDSEMAEMRNVAGEIKGAEFVLRYCVEKGIKSVKIVYDYMGIEAWATGKWKTNKVGTIAYKAYYDSIKDKVSVEFEKVKGHSGDKYNDRADALAKEALGI